jgi:hypothetical protein
MGTHPSKVQGKCEHKETQPKKKKKTKPNNPQKSGKDSLHSWLQNDNQR